MGRVKIRFPGTRTADHEKAAGAGASDSETDSAWVRVASNWAGNGPGSSQQCGTIGLPRIGTEVLLNFLGGDPDKPVIIGQLYNQQARPPDLSGEDDLPANRYISGIKSREIRGVRGNRLRLDDTNKQISAQLSSDHGSSQLTLGFLTSPRCDGGGQRRGQGAELRSDNSISVRGVEGVLITAEEAATNGSHLYRGAMSDLAQRLQKIAEQLWRMASTHANDEADSTHASELVQKLLSLERQAAPIVGIFGPEGIVMGSAGSLLLDASKGVNIVSAEHVRIGAVGKISLRSANCMSLFSNQGGTKITAASGRISAQAQSDGMELLAKKVMDIISTSDWINIRAQQGVRISGGGSEIVIDAQGIKGYTGGNYEMHALVHQSLGARAGVSNLYQEFPELWKLLTDKTWVEVTLMNRDEPAKNERYILTDADGERHEGKLDNEGFARIDSIVSGHCKLEFPEIGQVCDLTT
jgi:type VI secretion system secreted protein VgrG